MRRIYFWIVLAIGLAWLFKKPLQELYEKRVSGLQAAADATTMNGYTTYNTQVYTPPLWTPILNFFKANSYAPGSGDAASAQQTNYSVQG